MFNIGAESTKPKKAKDVEIKETEYIKCSDRKFTKFFGEGLTPGMVFTLSAPRGIGKTRFLLQLLEQYQVDNPNIKCAYLSNEESVEQLAATCKKLNVENIDIAHMKDIDEICEEISKYQIVIVDAFQGLLSKKKLKEIEYANKLICASKSSKTVLGIIVHRTKAGKEKGGSGVAHMVDMCIHMNKANYTYWEYNGELGKMVIVHCDKNRLGPENFIISYMLNGVHDVTKSSFIFTEFTEEIVD